MTKNTDVYDVLVAGAGPAGSAPAILLARAGLRVCLLDRDEQRPFRIGESLPGATGRLLGKLGIDGMHSLLDAADMHTCTANASAWGTEDWVYQDALLNPEGGGWHIDRTAFDRALQKKAAEAGALSLSANITGAAQQEGHYSVAFSSGGETRSLRATWLIDATGRKAALGRMLGLQRQRLDRQTALVGWVRCDAGDADHCTRVCSVRDGWWYTALLPGQVRVIGFYGQPGAVLALHRQRAGFLQAFNKCGVLDRALHPDSLLDLRTTDAGVARASVAATGRLFCAGDTALSLDPLSSQGIFFALYSGIRAAGSILDGIADPQRLPQIIQDYRDLVGRVFEANQHSRRDIYASEWRFRNEPYWRERSGQEALQGLL